MTAPPEPTLIELVAKLIAAVDTLSDRYDRDRAQDAQLRAQDARVRRTDRRVRALIVLAVVGMLLGGLLYRFVEVPARRQDTSNQIRDLACYAVRLRPPGYSSTSDALRARYRCPPFDPTAPGALPSGSTQPGGAPSATVTAPRPSTSTSPRADGPDVVTPTSASTSTHTVRVPARPSSAASSSRTPPPVARPPSSTPTPAATSPADGAVNRIICPVISTPLLCH